MSITSWHICFVEPATNNFWKARNRGDIYLLEVVISDPKQTVSDKNNLSCLQASLFLDSIQLTNTRLRIHGFIILRYIFFHWFLFVCLHHFWNYKNFYYALKSINFFLIINVGTAGKVEVSFLKIWGAPVKVPPWHGHSNEAPAYVAAERENSIHASRIDESL